MDPQAIEIAFHDDHSIAAGGGGAVEVVNLQRLAQTDRQFVLGSTLVHRAARIGYQFPRRVADRDHDAAVHHAGSRVKAHTELCRGSAWMPRSDKYGWALST